MGIFSKLIQSQRKHMQEAEEKQKRKVHLALEEMLTLPDGFSRGGKKAAFIGSNKIYKEFTEFTVDYIGGYHESPEGKENVIVMLIPQGLLFNHINNKDILSFSDMKTVLIKTETEIQNDVTLARMVAFGIYSLAMKKKKKVVNNYLVLNCKKNEMPYTVVFSGKDVLKLYKELFKQLAG